MNADIINAAFELFASLFVLRHCQVLWRDRRVRGVSAASVLFFTVWGLWNLYYYPALGQTWSLIAAIAVVLANALYLALILKFRREERAGVIHLSAQREPACYGSNLP